MAISINTNIPSQQAQISLERAQNGLDTAMQRLATGYRINSAADDAAGLQISNRMTAQINGLTVAVRNANDGISIAQTAEGAMNETTSLLQQMRDLAVQSASDSNSAADREALNDEVVQLVAELNRIASSTSFGGQNLLDGSFINKNIQVGAYADEVIPVSVKSAAGSELGINGVEMEIEGFTLGQPVELKDVGSVKAQSLTVGVNGVKSTIPIEAGASASDIVTAVSNAVPEVMGLANTSVTVDFDGATIKTGDTLSITVNGIKVTSSGDGQSIEAAVADLVAELQSNDVEVVQVGNNNSSKTALTITDPSGANMLISLASSGDSFNGIIISNKYDGSAPEDVKATGRTSGTTFVATGAIQWIATDPTDTYTFSSSGDMLGDGDGDGDKDKDKDEDKEKTAKMGSAVNMSVNTLDISTYAGAQQAITIIDHALADIDSNRATLGAIQNRFQHTIYNLQNVRENMMASRSRIEDTDYASEMSTLTREQVLKQASMASLNRANQMQQDVLTLIN